MDMQVSVRILGFEPALDSFLRALLGNEPDLVVTDEELTSPDILLVKPLDPDWLRQLRARYPDSRLLVVLEWHRQARFTGVPMDDCIDPLDGYRHMLERVLAVSLR